MVVDLVSCYPNLFFFTFFTHFRCVVSVPNSKYLMILYILILKVIKNNNKIVLVRMKYDAICHLN